MRAPQQDRSRLTRHRLLEATVDCLAEFGWSATTVAVVAQRAGVSRGAAQHHFPTREDLITAALEFMFDSRMEQARREVTELPTGEGRTEAVVARLVDYYTGTLFKAALQVWTAAAADPELRDRVLPLQERFGRIAQRTADYFLAHLPPDGVALWDLSLAHDSGEPRDSSASAIAACGLLDLAEQLPRGARRDHYHAAGRRLVESLFAECAVVDAPAGGLLRHGTYHRLADLGVDECNLWGDYYYLEALARLQRGWTSYDREPFKRRA